MRFVHAADIHLDSPMRGLQRYEGAPEAALRGATRRALENLVQLCVDEDAELLLVAGDLYDGSWRDYATGLFFAEQMSKLREAGVRVMIVRGNHDAASQITRHLRLPENVKELSSRKPETVVYDELGVAVHGQSFPTKAVTDDLSRAYPAPVAGAINVGLLHTSADGREGHAPYAPCSPAALADKGYDYWALGHVHTREVLSESPWVVFPGNLQGRHARETGAKGATLVVAEAGRVVSVQHRVLDVARWAQCRVAVTDAMREDDWLAAAREALEAEVEAAEGRPVAARVVLRGRGHAHQAAAADPERVRAELQAMATDVGGVWVERLVLERSQEPAAPIPEGLAAELLGAVRGLREASDAEVLALGEEALGELRGKLPPHVEGEDSLDLSDPAEIRRLLGEVEETIALRLFGAEGDA